MFYDVCSFNCVDWLIIISAAIFTEEARPTLAQLKISQSAIEIQWNFNGTLADFELTFSVKTAAEVNR